jgi:hypothetical protein
MEIKPLTERSIRAHAATIAMLEAERAAHRSFREEVSEAARVWKVIVKSMSPNPSAFRHEMMQFCGQPVPDFDRFIIEKPDPLASAWEDVWEGDYGTPKGLSDFCAALAKHGLKIVEVDHD